MILSSLKKKESKIEIAENKYALISEIHNIYKDELDKINNAIYRMIDSDEGLIEDISKHLLKNTGKRIRPLLTIISSKIFGYEGDKHINLASAVEFIHAATLLHDDVVDNSLVRRFMPSANSIWGNKASILVGDFLFSSSFRLMVSSESIKCLSSLANASSIIATGEVSQLSSLNNGEILSIDNYMSIISAKTAELFAAACEVGAIISEAEITHVNLLKEFGKNLGIIYQIRDDWLDYFSTSDDLGKNIGDDFQEGKFTLPTILLFDKLSDQKRKFIKEIFLDQKLKTKSNFDKLIDLMNKFKIKEEIDNIIENLANKSENLLDRLMIKNQHLEVLRSIVNFASSRSS